MATYGIVTSQTRRYKVIRAYNVLGTAISLSVGDIVNGRMFMEGNRYVLEALFPSKVLFYDAYNIFTPEVTRQMPRPVSRMPYASTMRNDAGTTAAAPAVSLSIDRNKLPRPVIFISGILLAIAIVAVVYKYYPQIFKRYLKPKTD